MDKAATGVMRAAFGLDGQKCSACSRVYVQQDVYPEFRDKLLGLTNNLKVGDPTAGHVHGHGHQPGGLRPFQAHQRDRVPGRHDPHRHGLGADRRPVRQRLLRHADHRGRAARRS
ncbi:MAG: aldehyde dehydrogenase family protein [Caldilineaceae bacterium]